MPPSLTALLRHVRRLAKGTTGAAAPSAKALLQRFLHQGDEQAFASLVHQYGPLVLATCRRLLGNVPDADDAFQATFFVLARRAGSIRQQESLAGWLHGTAVRVCQHQRAETARRRHHERQAAAMRAEQQTPKVEAAWDAVVDEEVGRLPDKYRAPLVLCYLEGLTNTEAATQLGWPEGTVKGRLARARRLLRRRLLRRGLAAIAGTVAVDWARPATAAVSQSLNEATVQTAVAFVSGTIAAEGTIPAVALAEGVMQTMKTRWLFVMVLVVAGSLFGIGAPIISSLRPPQPAPSKHAVSGPSTLVLDENKTDAPKQLEPIVQAEHRKPDVYSFLAQSTDGKRFVTAGDQGGVATLWDTETGKKLRTFYGQNAAIGSVAISGDGKRILGSSFDKLVTLWDADTGAKLKTLGAQPTSEYSGFVGAACLSHDGKRALAHYYDYVDGNVVRGTVFVWDIDTGKQIQCYKGSVLAALLCPDGKHVLIGEASGRLALRGVDTGKEIRTFKGHTGGILSLAVNGDGKRLVSGSYDKNAIVWDVESGKTLHAFECGFVVQSISLSGNGKRVLTRAKSVTLWDADNGKKLRDFDVPKPPACVSLRQDGKQAFIKFPDSTVSLLDNDTGKQLRIVNKDDSPLLVAALSSNGARLVTCTGTNTVIVWDLLKGQPAKPLEGYTDAIWLLSLSRDGKRIVTIEDKNVRLTNADTGKPLGSFGGFQEGLSIVVVSADGRRVLAYKTQEKMPPLLFDAESGKELRSFATGSLCDALCLSENGNRALTLSWEGMAILWDAEKGEKLHSFQVVDKAGATVPHLRLSNDGRMVLAFQYRGNTATLWDAETGKRLRTLESNMRLEDGWLSADSRRAFTSADNGTIIAWDTETGKKLQTFEGHTAVIVSLWQSVDGKRVVSASADGTIRFWDAGRGKELGQLHVLNSGKDWLIVTPEGYFDGSDNAARYLSYRVAGTLDFVPTESVQKRFHRSGLLAEMMGGKG